MKAIICEYLWQLEYIERDPDALLVSISPDMSFQLTKRGLKFRECSEFCQHSELWPDYPEFVNNLFSFVARLDEILWDEDPRFRNLNIPIFDRMSYRLKISHDQSIYYAHLIRELLDSGVDKVICADNGGPAVDKFGKFLPEKSVIAEIIRAFGDKGPSLILQTPAVQSKKDNSPGFSFSHPIMLINRFGLANAVSNLCNSMNGFKYSLKSITGTSRKRCTVLSVGCKEVDSLDPAQFRTISLLKFEPQWDHSGSQNDWAHLNHFLEQVSRDEKVNQVLTYRGANLTGLLLNCIRALARDFEVVLKEYNDLFAFLDRREVDFVVFSTMSPSYLSNVLVYEWCQARAIPFACWMHGGYGAYASLQGYDVTDYRLSHYHMVYGQVLANLPDDPNCILHKLGYTNRLKQMYVTGSPFFEKTYSNYHRPDNNKKKILFCLGNYFNHNKFSFGHNRANSELSIWSAHKKILEVLLKFQNTYEIIVKDYPVSPQEELWRTVLSDLGAEKISYVTHERPFHEVLVEADLHIFSWVSTTLFQSMYTDSDICLYDNTDLTNEAMSLFERHVLFSSDLEVFCSKLEKYLDAGKFYTQDKNPLQSHFVDIGNISRRAERFESVVNRIVAGDSSPD